MGTGDSYKRIEVAPGRYQCGCEWKKLDWVGEFLSECAIHSAATASSVRKFDRERAERAEVGRDAINAMGEP